MSKGPGAIERRIADLLAATRDRALSIDEIADNAYQLGGRPPTRAQRLAATRAAHRLLKRVRDTDTRVRKLRTEASRKAGPQDRDGFWKAVKAEPEWIEAERLWDDYVDRIGAWVRWWRADDAGPPRKRGDIRYQSETDYWQTTAIKGRLYLHPPDAPVQVWAVTIDPTGVHWFPAEVVKITERNVMVRYDGELARLDRRRLWYWWAFYRRVRFVSMRSGRIARELDDIWWQRYGEAASASAPPAMQLQLARAIELLGGLPDDYTREDIIAAFRQAVKRAHPDVGGTAEMFRLIVEARDRVLASLGQKAPAPKPPTYAPSDWTIRYTTARRRSQTRLGSTRMLR